MGETSILCAKAPADEHWFRGVVRDRRHAVSGRKTSRSFGMQGHAPTSATRSHKDYPDKNITIVPDLVPYGPLWRDKIAANFAIHDDAFDFSMWDSQSTAEFAGGGHGYPINKVFEEAHYLKANLFSPLSLYPHGEYPGYYGKYWSTSKPGRLWHHE
jgi:multiple sugar transport system substrate-binding protein